MRILVVGEGSTDIGQEQADPPDGDSSGFLPTITRRLLNAPPRISLHGINVRNARLRLQLTKGKSQKFSKLVLAAARFARADNCGAVVVVVDRDAKPNERRLQALRKGRDAATADYDIPIAVGVSIEMIEAWLLADEVALAAALDIDTLPKQRSPERDKTPKETLATILANHGREGRSMRELGRRVAETARIDVLCERCPRGFATFADDVIAQLGRLARPRRQTKRRRSR